MPEPKMPMPPWRAKVVEEIPDVPPERRKKAIYEAGFNTFLLASQDVTIDLLTDSGTNGMYNTQRAAMELGDEAYAGSESFFKLEAAVKQRYGMPHVIPTHQGRAAEHIMSKILVKPGQYVLSNMYFTTSRAHVEVCGGTWKDVSILEASDPANTYRFKGCVNIEKLECLIKEIGQEKIAFVRVEACLNMAGGQPFTMANIRGVRRVTEKYGLPILLDATRAIENSYFIKTSEPGFEEKSVAEILYEMCSFADIIIVSAKKDGIANIGGLLLLRNSEYLEDAEDLTILHEGFVQYGGLAGRDMEAIAEGLGRAVDFRYIEHRVAQVRYLWELLKAEGVPLVSLPGGHGVYLDAERFLSHIPQEQFPAQALAAAIYEECGVRGMERGIASAGRDPKTGKNHASDMELVRLTIPRLVYTEAHFQYVAEGIARVFGNHSAVRGLKMVYEPKRLRFFRARFESV